MPVLPSTVSPRLSQQLTFLIEIDRLKTILRQTRLIAQDRHENSAEHSWHLAMLALILVEHANEPLDLSRVLKLVLVHDVVEVDAGDTFCYDTVGRGDKAQREHQAATRLFGLLPADQGQELWALWQEYEARQTAEARFAAALDRLMPLLHNCFTEGATWRRHGIAQPQVLAHNAAIAGGSGALWELAQQLIAEAVAQGYLAADVHNR